MDMITPSVGTAVALIEAGDYLAAFAKLRAILQQQPNSIDAYMALGCLLYKNRQFLESAGCYHKVLLIDPDHAMAMIYLGIVCSVAGDYDAAIDHLRRGCAQQPELGHHNLAVIYYDLGKPRDALRHLDSALVVAPQNAEVHCLRAHTLLALGRFSEGWQEYEWRRQVPVARMQGGRWAEGTTTLAEHFGLPETLRPWRGEAAQHLVIHYEQGFGDTIQWARYVPGAAARCTRVTLVVPESMLTLFAYSFAAIHNLHVATGMPPDYDVHVWLDSLPRIFQAQIKNIPTKPYVRAADPAVWAHRLAHLTRPRIGLVWAGRPGLITDQWRSIPVEQLAGLLSVDVDFVSLQLGHPAPAGVHDLSPYLQNWQDTADAISVLDLLVSVDTACVHLAGALGKPVWLLNRYNTCWRWLLNRSDSPWYPSLRVFRQSKFGEWAPVLAQVSKKLARMAATIA